MLLPLLGYDCVAVVVNDMQHDEALQRSVVIESLVMRPKLAKMNHCAKHVLESKCATQMQKS